MARISFDEQVARWLRRSNPGYLGGRSESVGPPLLPQAALETFKLPFTKSGLRPATRVVGIKTSGHVVSEVDYLCDGSNDYVEIQAAIDEVAALNNGGRVLLLEGLYDGGGVGVALNGADVTLQGQGTSTRFADMVVSVNASLCRVQDLFSDEAVILNSGDECVVANVMVDANGDYGIATNGASDSLIIGCATDAGSIAGIAIESSERIRVIGCWDRNSTVGLYVAGSALHCTLAGNISRNSQAAGLLIEGNSCAVSGNIAESAGSIGFAVVGTDCVVSGNVASLCLVGISVQGGHRAVIVGNQSTGSDQDGISLASVADCLIADNAVYGASAATDDTHSGIRLVSAVDRCYVTGNTVRRAGAGNQPLYGIRVDHSSCDDNLIVHNDLLLSSKTGGNEFSDVGTGTVTTLSGNRT